MSIYDSCHERGGMTKDYWDRDPRRLAFVLARYKFVARMFEGMGRVLEVGCADGFGSRIVRQHVGNLVAIDIDAQSIAEARKQGCIEWPVEFMVHDISSCSLAGHDGVYALDVLEHVALGSEEDTFLSNIRKSAPVAIIGSPSIESQAFASELSRAGHVNCKTGLGLKLTLARHWRHIFVFGMNDETVHTGFHPMAHYRLALCVA